MLLLHTDLRKKSVMQESSSSTPSKDSTLVDPSTVSVIGAVSDKGTVPPPTAVPTEKKPKKDKCTTSKPEKAVASKSATDSKIEELDQKWSDRFNRLEVMLMAKAFQPTFSSSVKVMPSHSSPANVSKDIEPFFNQLHQSTLVLTPLLSISQLRSGPHPSGECTGKDSSAVKHQSTSQLRSDQHQPNSYCFTQTEKG